MAGAAAGPGGAVGGRAAQRGRGAGQGETEEETLLNIKEAIELYVEGLAADRQPIPSDDVHFKEIEIAA